MNVEITLNTKRDQLVQQVQMRDEILRPLIVRPESYDDIDLSELILSTGLLKSRALAAMSTPAELSGASAMAS